MAVMDMLDNSLSAIASKQISNGIFIDQERFVSIGDKDSTVLKSNAGTPQGVLETRVHIKSQLPIQKWARIYTIWYIKKILNIYEAFQY